jgi:hypothetical protein
MVKISCGNAPSSSIRKQILFAVLAMMVCLGGCAVSDPLSDGDKGGRMSKVAPELINLHNEYLTYRASGTSGMFKSSNSLVQVVDDRVVIDAVASGEASVLKADLESLGTQHAVAFGRIVSGQLPISAIPSLATLASLNFARAASAVLQGGGPSVRPGTPNR